MCSVNIYSIEKHIVSGLKKQAQDVKDNLNLLELSISSMQDRTDDALRQKIGWKSVKKNTI